MALAADLKWVGSAVMMQVMFLVASVHWRGAPPAGVPGGARSEILGSLMHSGETPERLKFQSPQAMEVQGLGLSLARRASSLNISHVICFALG